jgi:hypothetical protein
LRYQTLSPDRCFPPLLFAFLTLGNQPLLFLFLARLLRPQFTQRNQVGQRLVLIDFGKPRLDLGKQRADARCVPSHVVIAVARGCADVDTRAAGRHRADPDSDINTKPENERLVRRLDQAWLVSARRDLRDYPPAKLLHRIANRAECCVRRTVDRQGLQVRIGLLLKIDRASLKRRRVHAFARSKNGNLVERGRIGGICR